MLHNSNNQKFRQVIQSKRLPTLPEVAQQLIEIAKQSDPDTDELCRVIKTDPALSVKILKTVNAAIFAFRPRIETIENAVPRLGTSLIRTLIISFHLSEIKYPDGSCQKMFQSLWQSCLTQAVIAELLAENTNNEGSFCFLAAMLQDIGILAISSEFFDEYVENVLAHSDFPNVVTSEREHFGFSHVDVTLEILRRWNLDTTYGGVIRQHHNAISSSQIKNEKVDPATILQAATLGTDLILRRQKNSAGNERAMAQWLSFLGTHFDLGAGLFDSFFEEVKSRMSEYSIIYKFDIGDPPNVQQLMSDANELLQDIALKNQMNLLTRTDNLPKKPPQENELYRDFQTNLFNRRFLNEHLNQEIDKWIRKRKPLALMFVDIDKFKSVNDEFGHASGDEAIDHVGKWLTNNLRKDDYAIRFGGDEFLVVMQTKEKYFRTIAERICTTIPPLKIDGKQEIEISLSIGGIFYLPGSSDQLDVNSLIANADQIMYRVKRHGGGQALIRNWPDSIDLPVDIHGTSVSGFAEA